MASLKFALVSIGNQLLSIFIPLVYSRVNNEVFGSPDPATPMHGFDVEKALSTNDAFGDLISTRNFACDLPVQPP